MNKIYIFQVSLIGLSLSYSLKNSYSHTLYFALSTLKSYVYKPTLLCLTFTFPQRSTICVPILLDLLTILPFLIRPLKPSACLPTLLRLFDHLSTNVSSGDLIFYFQSFVPLHTFCPLIFLCYFLISQLYNYVLMFTIYFVMSTSPPTQYSNLSGDIYHILPTLFILQSLQVAEQE